VTNRVTGGAAFALRFGGSDNVVVPSLLNLPDLAGQWTLETFVTLEQPVQQTRANLVEFDNQAVLRISTGDNLFSFGSYHDGKRFKIDTPVLAKMGQRAHLAAVRSAEGIRVFVDGKLAGFTPGPLTPLDRSDKPFEMGGHLVGVLDEVRISKVARYDKEFIPQARHEPDLGTVALYHYDEGQGDALKDSSGNSHHGQIVGAKWVQADDAHAGPPFAKAPFNAEQANAHQDAWSKHLGVEAEITNSLGMKLRLIPPGDFTMGSTAEEIAAVLAITPGWNKPNVQSEGPPRRVSIERPFYLGIHEVTVGQFRAFFKDTLFKTWGERTGTGGRGWDSQKMQLVLKPGFVWSSSFVASTENHPVVLLHREDVEAFCAWLSEKEGRTYGLPTEEQWEFACRAGTVSPWFWGEDESQTKQFCWFGEAATSARQMPVGLKSPNAFGLFDLAGNASEMALDPSGKMILRGGNAGCLPHQLRSAARERENHSDPTYRNGFRIAITGELKP